MSRIYDLKVYSFVYDDSEKWPAQELTKRSKFEKISEDDLKLCQDSRRGLLLDLGTC